MWPRWALAIALCALLNCKNEGPRRVAQAAPSASSLTEPAARAPAESSAASVVSRGFDSAVAERFIEHWLAVQNEHDFAAYSALYAPRFSGIKRVGGYSKRFDRSAWLRDRQAMFRDGVVVRAAQLQLSGSAGAVRAVFTQDFVAPGFHDTGTKELILLAQPAGFAISREEMLASRLTEPAPASASDGTVLAFHRDGAVLAWHFGLSLAGEPRLLPRGASDMYDVASPIEPAALSKETRAWLGRTLTVYTKNGAVCQGMVTRFELRVSALPHFGMQQAWAGEGGLPKAPPAQIAAEIWGIARDDERFVVGVLDHECHGVWVVTQARPFTLASAPSAALRERALSAFKTLPGYAALQARFAKDAQGTSTDPAQPWETLDGVLNVVEVRSSPTASLLVVAASGGTGCAEFGGNLSAIWKVSGSSATPTLTLRGVFKDAPGLLQVNGAVDQNADGTLELLAGPGANDAISVLRLAASGYESTTLLTISNWDCGC